jgi:hypothetical protein
VDMGAYELQFHYVDQNGTNPISPFSSWTTAATNIQDAVDAASNYDEVLVTNGIYQYGGRPLAGLSLTNRLVVTNQITVQSVNGPAVTVIKGYQLPRTNIVAGYGPGAIRCVALANRASLIGFTLTNGATIGSGGEFDRSGGGLLSIPSKPPLFVGNNFVSNCIIAGNVAEFYGGGAFCAGQEFSYGGYGNILTACTIISNVSGIGGGVMGGSVANSVIVGNVATAGGGAVESLLTNCTVVSNVADGYEDGPAGGALYNCILYSNSSIRGNYFQAGPFFSCCTYPMPTNGIGNITNAPLFVNPAAGDFHLQSNSPCINAGNNAYAGTTTDLDGKPRISGGTVDIGAYEFQNPASIISYAWLDQYNLPTDGSADFLDPDHDGLNNWQEWLAGTDPTNASSVLQMLAPAPSGTNLIVTWQSAANITYSLQRATDLTADPAFSTIATNLPGNAGTTSYTDTNAPPPGPYFYRVGVQ